MRGWFACQDLYGYKHVEIMSIFTDVKFSEILKFYNAALMYGDVQRAVLLYAYWVQQEE